MTAPAHKLCMIPGPVEFHEEVLEAMATPATSHVSQTFINIFGETLEQLKAVLFGNKTQPFVVAGGGTLGWEMVAANLIEAGEKVLVLNTGLFGDRLGECLETYGAQVTHLRAPIGNRPSLEQIEQTLKTAGPFELVTVTHVDTSTGVLSDVEAITRLVKQISPKTLVVVDGVCSVGVEPTRMDDWGIDIVTTASQKALGAPPGLAIVLASEQAMNTFHHRKSPIPSYYASWKRWLPIMQSYEQRKGSYFSTPAVQVIMALNVSLKHILARGMDQMFEKHKEASKRVKETVQRWGLKLVTASDEVASHAMTAVYYPEGATDLTKCMWKHGVVVAGGLHPKIAAEYFRIGHMGISVCELERHHLDTTLKVLKTSLRELGFHIPDDDPL